MKDELLENNKRNQDIRMNCIDMATRVVGKPMFLADGSKQHDDVVEVAEKIYEFIMKT